MRRLTVLFIALLFCICLFAGCSNSNQETQNSGSDSQSTTSQPTTAASVPVSSESGTGNSSSAGGSADLGKVMASLTAAAGLGSTIEVSELDLKASGIDTNNVVNWAGKESKMSAENGGIVMVFQMQPGTTADLADQLKVFRDARASDDRYAEFAEAIAHTKDARIVTEGNYVVYAVSATGEEGYAAVDVAIVEAFS